MLKLLSYTDRLWARPGDTVTVHASAEGIDTVDAELVRLVCGDTSPGGPGYREEAVAGTALSFPGGHQPLHAGSCIVADDAAPFTALDSFTLQIIVWPTTPLAGEQAVMGLWDSEQAAGFS